MIEKNATLLTNSHYVFLSREQRYELLETGTLDVIGVSVPVWCRNSKTSEPAVEVFCNYKLKCTDSDMSIRFKDNGYIVNLPKSDAQLTVNHLRDYKDGGSQYLGFRYGGRLKVKGDFVRTTHFIEIKELEELKEIL